MKVKITVAVIVVSIILVAFWNWPYSDDFTVDLDQVSDEVVRIIEKNPTEEGIEKATKFYRARQFKLSDKREWGARPDKNGAVSETVRQAHMNAFSRMSVKMGKLENKYPALGRSLK